jgi:hypothetical protein
LWYLPFIHEYSIKSWTWWSVYSNNLIMLSQITNWSWLSHLATKSKLTASADVFDPIMMRRRAFSLNPHLRNESFSWLNYHAHAFRDEPNPCHIYPWRVQASVMVKVHHSTHVVRIDLKSKEYHIAPPNRDTRRHLLWNYIKRFLGWVYQYPLRYLCIHHEIPSIS